MVAADADRFAKLRVFNLVMGALHAVSATLMVILGNDFSLDISTLNLNGPPGTAISDGTLDSTFSVPVAAATAAFLYLSAVFHFLVASPLGFGAYRNELLRGRNRFRWVEYAFSSTLMIILIALVVGITDLAAIIAVSMVNASMILFGWLMETPVPAGREVEGLPLRRDGVHRVEPRCEERAGLADLRQHAHRLIVSAYSSPTAASTMISTFTFG